MRRGTLWIACEVAHKNLTPDELGNIQHRLAAGFLQVAVICPDGAHLNEVRAAVEEAVSEADRHKVVFYTCPIPEAARRMGGRPGRCKGSPGDAAEAENQLERRAERRPNGRGFEIASAKDERRGRDGRQDITRFGPQPAGGFLALDSTEIAFFSVSNSKWVYFEFIAAVECPASAIVNCWETARFASREMNVWRSE